VPTDSSRENQSESEIAGAGSSSPQANSQSAGATAKPAAATPPMPMMGPSTMIATPGGGDAWPGPLAEKHFAGEIPCDFETALKMVQEDGPSADVSRKGSMRSRIAEWLGLKPSDGPALRQDRHVAFDGFRSPLHDEKTERDRRYGTVYSVIECANAYLVGLDEFPPRR
jgi:hypothetical protein